MPLIRMETSEKISEEEKPKILRALTKIVSEATGKPEAYVMAIVAEASFSMASITGPAAFLDVRSIGSINKQVNGKISKDVAALLGESLGIADDRIFISFTDVSGSNWGWKGATLA